MTTFILLCLQATLLISARGSAPSAMLLPPLNVNSTHQAIQQYEIKLNDWVIHPENLNKLSAAQLIDLSMQIGGASLRQILPKPEWIRLRQSETKLIGLIVASLCGRIDPGIDINRPMHGRYPPYDDVAAPSELHDDLKRRTYDAQVRFAYSEDLLETNQVILHKQFDRLVWIVTDYLSASYGDKSKEAKNAVPILRDADLNSEIIAALLGK